MTKYLIVERGQQLGFQIEIQGPDGSRSTMLGFRTEDQASIWIEENKRLIGLSPMTHGD